jgi:heterotetrameric sarcosine oxidase gamma subunit
MNALEFLSVDAAVAGAVARSAMQAQAAAAGANFEQRDGWNVAVSYGDPAAEHEALTTTATWTDVSHLGKIELQCAPGQMGAIVARACDGAQPPLQLGQATPAAGAWWCPLTPQRLLAVAPPSRTPAIRNALADGAREAPGLASVVDVTTLQAALALSGPLVRELFARFCALDLRPQSTPLHGLRPGSVARTPAIVLREAQDRFLVLFGWGLGEYVWTVVADAGARLGARPVGVDTLTQVHADA